MSNLVQIASLHEEEQSEEVPLFPRETDEDMEETNRPNANTRQPSRFPTALKRARLAKQLKQETLAAQLHVKLRTLVSWETGTRIPSIGMVYLLSFLLTDRLDLSDDLLIAYIIDDLTRQVYSQNDEDFRALVLQIREQVSQLQTQEHEQKQERNLHLSLFGNQSREGRQEYHLDQKEIGPEEPEFESTTGNPLQQLFAVLETLRSHTELIPVVQDFLREVVSE